MSSNLSLIEAGLTFWNFSSRSLTSLSTIRLKPKNDECTLNNGNNDNSSVIIMITMSTLMSTMMR